MGCLGCSCKGCVGITDEDGDGRESQRGYKIKQSAMISLSTEVVINWETKTKKLNCSVLLLAMLCYSLEVCVCGQIERIQPNPFAEKE